MKDKRLSILLVTNQLIYGGAERYTVSVANELVKRSRKVVVVTRGGPMSKLLSKKVKIYYAPVRETDIISRFRTVLAITKACWKENIQIIHTQSTTGALAARIAGIFFKVPIIKTAHGWPEGQFPSVARTLNFTTDKVVMISDWLSRRLVSFGLNKNKARTILNGINVEEFALVKLDREKSRKRLGFTNKDKLIISVARIVPEKQFEQLIYWFPYILARVPNAKLLIVGSGGADGDDYRNRVIEQTRKAGLGRYIKFLEGTDKVAELLKIADVFCTPSVGKGLAVLEAMAAGLPVVARKPRGLVDTVVDGVNGLLFTGGDWVTMVEKVAMLLGNKQISIEFGKQGKILVNSRYTLSQMVDALEELYSLLVKKATTDRKILVSNTLQAPVVASRFNASQK